MQSTQSTLGNGLLTYTILFCQYCKLAQMTTSKEALKCIKCGKTTPFINRELWEAQNSQEASEIVKKLKEKTKNKARYMLKYR